MTSGPAAVIPPGAVRDQIMHVDDRDLGKVARQSHGPSLQDVRGNPARGGVGKRERGAEAPRVASNQGLGDGLGRRFFRA